MFFFLINENFSQAYTCCSPAFQFKEVQGRLGRGRVSDSGLLLPDEQLPGGGRKTGSFRLPRGSSPKTRNHLVSLGPNWSTLLQFSFYLTPNFTAILIYPRKPLVIFHCILGTNKCKTHTSIFTLISSSYIQSTNFLLLMALLVCITSWYNT